MFRSSGEANFDKLLDRATSHLLLEVDLGAVLGITDLIRQKDCTPKYAVAAIRKKLATPNPHVGFYSLQVLEAIVKNCGSPSHEEVATKEFMEFLRELAKTTNHDNVRDKILELIQTWAHAFRKLSSYRAVQDCVNIMKAEGCKFPPLSEADAMFTSDTAPEWQEGECCNRCRVQFGLLNRKHHCRACGQIFCAKCSSKVCPVPKFGIEKEVRVCDSCFEKYGKPKTSPKAEKVKKVSTNFSSSDEALQAAIEASLSEFNAKKVQHSQVQQPRGKTEAELKEEEDLALALAISQSEAEEKEREKQRRSTGIGTGSGSKQVNAEVPERDMEKSSNPTPKKGVMAKSNFEQEDPELARYLDRNYWEQRHGQGQTKEEQSREETGAMLHNKSPSPFQPSAPAKENKNKIEQVEEMDGFMESLRASIEMFVNRMRSNSNRGRHVSNDSTVQSLFLNITSLHSQLLNYIQAQDDWRAHYERLQEKLMQVHDARDALDDLRKDYGEKQRRIAEEIERQRQHQRAIKLQDMRQQKHLYLQQQRELALRRVQDEERQMQLRMEQQRVGTYGGYPIRGQGYMGPPPPSQMPPGMMVAPPQGQGQGQEAQQMGQYLPPQHYMQGQHSNTMLAQHMPQGQGQGQPGYGMPYMGLPHQQMQMYMPPGQVGQNLPPQSQQQMLPPMSQGQGIPISSQGYMSPPQNFYQQMVGPTGQQQQMPQAIGQNGQQMMGQPGGPNSQQPMGQPGGSNSQQPMGQPGGLNSQQPMGQPGGVNSQQPMGQPGGVNSQQPMMGQPGGPNPQQPMMGQSGPPQQAQPIQHQQQQIAGHMGPPQPQSMVGPVGPPQQQMMGQDGPPQQPPLAVTETHSQQQLVGQQQPALSQAEIAVPPLIQREPSVAELISFD